jgi:hypothetical protein
MKVSLVVNTFNRMHTLPRTLESLKQLRYPHLEVIVVDGPSTDGTKEYLEENWVGKFKILSCSEANLSVSRNIGICAASGEIVAFTDDDGIPEPDWLNHIVPAYADPRVAAVGGFVRDNSGVEYQTRYIHSDRHGYSNELIEHSSELPPAIPHHMKFPRLIGVNSTFRRTSLLEIGGFDEEYAYFYDEVDVAIRLIDAGYDIKQVPEAEVHHKYAPSHIRTEKGVARTWLPIARSTAYYCIRNAPASQLLTETFKVIDEHRRRFVTHTLWATRHGNLSEDDTRELLSTLDQGITEGIRDAFAYPWRHLIKCNTPSLEWLPFERPRPKDRKYHLAFVTDLYPPRPCGGIAVFIAQLAQQLASNGHEVTVITFAEADRPHTVDFEHGVWVHRLSNNNTSEKDVDVPYLPDSMRAVSQAILAELIRIEKHRNFDWIIGTIWDLHLASVIASKRYSVAMYLVTSYRLMLDSKPEWHQNSHFYKHHVAPMMEGELWALKQADLILASTEAIRHDVEAAYGLQLTPSRLAIQPFGIRPPQTFPHHSDNNRVKLLFVGRFETRKGIDLLLDILPQLFDLYQNLHVTLVGDNSIQTPNGKTYIEKFLKIHTHANWLDRLEIPGIVSDIVLDQYYSECDIFVAPSRYESFGLIYVEAMRYGKACIGCNIGGIPEVVIDGETGILVPPNDSHALQKAIRILIEDNKLRQSLGKMGLKRYEERYTLASFAEGFINKLTLADNNR